MNHKEDKVLLMDAQESTAQVVHAREVAALIESLGHTDRSAREWGFPDIFSLAEHLFARLQQNPVPDQRVRQKGERLSLWEETRCALRKFSLSLAYAIPWMVMLTLEYLRPDALRVSPEIGGALSLSLIGSLSYLHVTREHWAHFHSFSDLAWDNGGFLLSFICRKLPCAGGHQLPGSKPSVDAVRRAFCAGDRLEYPGHFFSQHSNYWFDKNSLKLGNNHSVDTLSVAGSRARARLCAGRFLSRREKASGEQV